MPKQLPQFKGYLPSENQAEAALFMEHECTELSRFVTLAHISIKYSIEYVTVEIATHALLKRGILEKREKKIGKNWWTRRSIAFYRRVQQ